MEGRIFTAMLLSPNEATLVKMNTVKSVITIAQVQEFGKENTLHLGQRYSVSLGCCGGDKKEYGAYDDTRYDEGRRLREHVYIVLLWLCICSGSTLT